jgi:hypothetical protein
MCFCAAIVWETVFHDKEDACRNRKIVENDVFYSVHAEAV